MDTIYIIYRDVSDADQAKGYEIADVSEDTQIVKPCVLPAAHGYPATHITHQRLPVPPDNLCLRQMRRQIVLVAIVDHAMDEAERRVVGTGAREFAAGRNDF